MEFLFGTLLVILGIVIGFAIGIFAIRSYYAKNPPISEEMIEAMLKSMGQAPSKKRVKQVMKQMKGASK